MLDPDVDTRRMLVRERHAVLANDAREAETSKPEAAESRIRRPRRHIGLQRLRFLRSAARP